jgi:exopolyphosphatase / guanosine-5'-triphosphate,3'-diphosphate pyrophosphatase
LLVVDDAGTTLARLMRITRLSEGVDATGRLTPAALARSYDVLDLFNTVMDEHGASRRWLAATSAARDAANGPAFLAEAARRTGAEVSILTGLEEATLTFQGATGDLTDAERAVVVDVGGGSTELAARVADTLVVASMQVGCVRVTERTLGRASVSEEQVVAANEMINAALEEAFVSAPGLGTLVGTATVVGVAGTVATLAQLDAERSVYDRSVVHHRELPLATIESWRRRLAAELPADRLGHPGMVRGREDVLVGGLLILEAVMRRFGASVLLSSECDLLDGMVAALQ